LFPQDASVHGHEIDALFWLACKLTVPTFFVVIGILVYCLIKFRARAGHRAEYTHGDSKGALGLTLGLAALVFVAIDVNLAWHDHQAFEKLFGHPPAANDDAVRVRVLAEQFLWSFRLPGAEGSFETPDAITLQGELHVPAGKTVVFELRSRDVIHSFCLPNMRVKQDILPGMTTVLYTEPSVPGRYEIMCAQLCGYGHYAMKGVLVVDSKEQYETWLRDRRAEFGRVARAH
jgi:cytochrome c oxidase subunit 2